MALKHPSDGASYLKIRLTGFALSLPRAWRSDFIPTLRLSPSWKRRDPPDQANACNTAIFRQPHSRNPSLIVRLDRGRPGDIA